MPALSKAARPARVLSRHPALRIARRCLGDSVSGPPITDLAANLRKASEFFTKDAVSYAEFKQQCASLRLFVFAGVTAGCALALIVDPPKSSYWVRWGPWYWFSHLKGTFSSSAPPLFLTKPANVIDAATLLRPAKGGLDTTSQAPSAAPARPAAPVAGAPPPGSAAALEERVAALERPASGAERARRLAEGRARNRGLLLLEPAAAREKVKELAELKLEACGVAVVAEGSTGAGSYYYDIEWWPQQLSWVDFGIKVLGSADPQTADLGSMRHLIRANWDGLGLKACPDASGGVRAPASPLEALAERTRVLDTDPAQDPFGMALLAAGVRLLTLRAWCSNPAVDFGGAKHSIFELLEGLDAAECIERCVAINASS
mmetsp:Transcript_17945/g.49528  ORF Transcript_17945/g.49528 Transcript_17945/m.49528 type:complete len:375 (-) Transcript_17945:266-1390(-)